MSPARTHRMTAVWERREEWRCAGVWVKWSGRASHRCSNSRTTFCARRCWQTKATRTSWSCRICRIMPAMGLQIGCVGRPSIWADCVWCWLWAAVLGAQLSMCRAASTVICVAITCQSRFVRRAVACVTCVRRVCSRFCGEDHTFSARTTQRTAKSPHQTTAPWTAQRRINSSSSFSQTYVA